MAATGVQRNVGGGEQGSMRQHRFWVALAAMAVAVAGSELVSGASAKLHSDPPDAAGPLDLVGVEVEQAGRDVQLTVRTTAAFNLAALDRRPDLSSDQNRYLCLEIHRSGEPRVRVLCFGTRPKAIRTPSATACSPRTDR
jgi:hypothetical protein